MPLGGLVLTMLFLSTAKTQVSRSSSPRKGEGLTLEAAMREGLGLWADVVSHYVALPHQTVFVDHQPIESYRAAGVRFIRADADLSAFAKAKAIRKTGRGIVHNGGRIDALEELRRCLWIFREDGVGMTGAVLIDMRHRLLQAVNNT